MATTVINSIKLRMKRPPGTIVGWSATVDGVARHSPVKRTCRSSVGGRPISMTKWNRRNNAHPPASITDQTLLEVSEAIAATRSEAIRTRTLNAINTASAKAQYDVKWWKVQKTHRTPLACRTQHRGSPWPQRQLGSQFVATVAQRRENSLMWLFLLQLTTVVTHHAAVEMSVNSLHRF